MQAVKCIVLPRGNWDMLLAVVSYHNGAVMYIKLAVYIHAYVGVMESAQAYNNRLIYGLEVSDSECDCSLVSTNHVKHLSDTERLCV